MSSQEMDHYVPWFHLNNSNSEMWQLQDKMNETYSGALSSSVPSLSSSSPRSLSSSTTAYPNTTRSDPLYEVPTYLIVLLSLFYGLISVLAFCGNTVVIWITYSCHRMHSITNFYIINLSCADIIISVLSIPFQFQAALLQRWELPLFMCPLCPFVQVLSVNVSIFTLVVIAVDRYCAIKNPLKHRPTKVRVKIVIGVIWAIGALLGLPYLIGARVTDRTEKNGVTVPFCKNVVFEEFVWDAYIHTLVCIQYYIPLVMITHAYIKICWVLWGAKTPGNAQGPRDATVLKKKKKVIKMLFVVVVLFVLCWLPFQIYMAVQAIFPVVNKYEYINIIFFCSHWLAMSNSCCNPFIYLIFNERFQKEFRSKFQCHREFHRHRSPYFHSDMSLSYSLRGRLNSQKKSLKIDANHQSQASFL